MFRVALVSIALFAFAAGLSADPSDDKIPHQKDEIGLVRIKGDPQKFAKTVAIVCGGVATSDYYNYAYANMEQKFGSLRFVEAGETFADIKGETATLYVPRDDVGAEILDALESAEEKSKGRKELHLVRVKAKIDMHQYLVGKQWNMLEVVDLQLFDLETGKWKPRIRETFEEAEREREDEARAKKVIEDARLEKVNAANKVEYEAKKAEADKKKAIEKAARDEKSAESKLKAANDLRKAGKDDAYRKTMRELVEKYPDTKAAEAARKALPELANVVPIQKPEVADEVVSEKDQAVADARVKKAAAEKNEKAAVAKLHSAEALIKKGNRTAGHKALRELVKEYPDTKAANKARQLLE